jgi:hypothetical protein
LFQDRVQSSSLWSIVGSRFVRPAEFTMMSTFPNADVVSLSRFSSDSRSPRQTSNGSFDARTTRSPRSLLHLFRSPRRANYIGSCLSQTVCDCSTYTGRAANNNSYPTGEVKSGKTHKIFDWDKW